MSRNVTPRIAACLLLVSLLALVLGLGALAANQQGRVHDRADLQVAMAKPDTVCVGRYLIDVPADADISLSGALIDGFSVAVAEESAADFRVRLQSRERDIERSPGDPGLGREGGMLEARDLHVPGMLGCTLIHGRSRGYMMAQERRIDMESITVESHGHIEGMSVSLAADSVHPSDAGVAEALLARVRLRAEKEVPRVAGFRVWRAVFADPLPKHRSEHRVMHLSLPRHPDLGLSFATLGGARGGARTLERIAATRADLPMVLVWRITALRGRERVIHGIHGQGAVARAREYNFATTYAFNREAMGNPDDPEQAFLSLELRTGLNARPGGPPVDTSLQEDALLALWDGIASSIRPHTAGAAGVH